MTAITLHQVAQLQQPAMKQYVINAIVQASPLAERIPFEGINQLSIMAPYLTSIPTPTFRHINEAGSEISSDFSQINAALSIFDNDIKLDPVVEKIQGTVMNTRQAQVTNASKAYAYQLVNKYINGDVTSDAREFDGIKRRLAEDPRFYGQVVSASANSTEVSLLVGSAADADYRNFWHKMNLLMLTVDPVMSADMLNSAAFVTNSIFMLTMEASLKQLRLYNQNQDQFGRTFMDYKGIPIIDAGFTPAGAISGSIPAGGNSGDLIIPNDNEAVTTTNGAAGAYDKQTPVYLIRFGREHNMGLQMGPMEVNDLGNDPSASPHYRIINLRWVVNPAAVWQKRAISRLVGYSPSGVTS